MRTRGGWFVLAGLTAASCFLPDVEFDPSVGKGAAGRGAGGGAGDAGSGGKAAAGGTGGGSGTGGNGGEAGADLSTQVELHCGTYCDLYFMACDGHEANTYDNKQDCFLTCVTSGKPLNDPSKINAEGTIECLEAHALLANTMGTDPHCFHSAEFPSKGACEVVAP
jgi:hypothetical protein